MAPYDADLPEPFWASVNPENRHAHLCYGLEAPVMLGACDRPKPMRYLAAIEHAMAAKLGADLGYSGLITKNPLHKHWETVWADGGVNWSGKTDAPVMRRRWTGQGIYSLAFLAEHLDLPKFIPKRKPEEVGLGRNVTIFDWLRQEAYREVRGWKKAGGSGVYVQWLTHLYHKALGRSGDMLIPLDSREVHCIAKSVSKWVWNRFDVAASDERFSKRQAARGRRGGLKSGEVRKAGSVSEAKPWEAEGVSRRTWFRRKSGLIVPS